MNVRAFIVIAVLSLPALLPGQEQTAVSPHGTFTIDIDCAACHNTDQWVPAKTKKDFDHDKATSFPLLGKHNKISCQSCHLDLKFAEPKVSADNCTYCHVDVHRGQFTRSCEACHNHESFRIVDGRRIHTNTLFPLTGAHQQVTCAACHADDANGAFTSMNTACFSCHEQDFNNATTIDHRANGFSTDCRQCHTTIAWGPATFDHAAVSNGFHLIAAHSRVTCSGCHRVPSMETIFSPTSEHDCFACHEADYNRVHRGSGFPHDCTVCHSQNSWEGGNFVDHDRQFFPIFSGVHRGLWNSCNDCHENSQNYVEFTCFNCHEHSQSRTDPIHRGVRGYTYQSQACYSCHPSGGGRGFD